MGVITIVWGWLVRSPMFRYVAGAVALFALIWVTHQVGYWRGEAAAKSHYETAIQTERQRLRLEKERALEEAERIISELETTVANREATLRRIRTEAAQDPNAGRVSIGADGVRRLNQVD